MSAVLEILTELARRGVVVRDKGDDTLGLRPKSALDPDLRARVLAHKPEILAMLRARPAACALTCYELEPGRWIHHPWDGCRTIAPANPAQRVERTCWHCVGSDGKAHKECTCLVCVDAGSRGPGICSICKGTGKTLTWVH
jgi:hypothetical protein